MSVDRRAILLEVVIPVYNVEGYLPQCLDGFLLQTSSAFHVLLIDDGSTDSSGEIAKSYADKYPERFTYVRQENKGLGAARNSGFRLVKAPYVWFFDSDDYCGLKAIEQLLEATKKYPDADCLFFIPAIFDMATSSYEPWHDREAVEAMFKERPYLSPKDDPRFFALQASVCRCLWKSSFLREVGLSFPEGLCWEDVPPHFLLMSAATEAAYVPGDGFYYYRINAPRKGQITTGTGKSRLDMGPILEEVKALSKKMRWDKERKRYCVDFLIDYCMWSLRLTRDSYRKAMVQILHAYFKSYSFAFLCYYWRHSPVPRKHKLAFALLRGRLAKNFLYSREKMEKKKLLFKKIKRFLKR